MCPFHDERGSIRIVQGVLRMSKNKGRHILEAVTLVSHLHAVGISRDCSVLLRLMCLLIQVCATQRRFGQ